MNVTCTGCPAKYAVPDEKVRGKKVRITCKHCGTNIVVDGTGGADLSVLPRPASEPIAKSTTASVHEITSAAPPAESPKAQAPVVEVSFVVGFTDDRQESHTLSQIVDMYSAGEIDDEVLVWKDGMADWLSPFDVPEIAAAMHKRGVMRRVPGSGISAVADDEPTVVGRSPFEDQEAALALAAATAPVVAPATVVAAAFASPRPAASTAPMAAKPLAAAAPVVAAAAAPVAAKAAAARRTEKRAGAVDLFGAVADAGSEADASLDFGSSEEPAHKMTGARNESSVLFSLDALTKPDAKANQKQKSRDKEEDRQATAALFGGDGVPDSLLNLGGGGGLAALAAPDFTKPVTAAAVEPIRLAAPVDIPNEAPPKKKGGVVILLGSFIALAAVAGGAFLMMKKQPAAETPATTPSAETKTATPGLPSTPEATTSSSAAEPSTAAATGAAATGSAEASATTVNPAAGKPTPPGTPATPAAAATLNKPAEPATATTAKKPDTPTPAPAAAPADGAAFDKGAAVAALGAAAASASSCKKPDGPTGSGKVSVTFAPSGRATATSVAGELAGTEVGGCVARLFRSAKVPPFSGDPVTVSKSFSVQ